MARQLLWEGAIEALRPFVVRISTPRGSGTGFFVARSVGDSVIGIATAAHVVEEASYWELPIRVDHHATGSTELFRFESRAIILDVENDTAVVVCSPRELKLPTKEPTLMPLGQALSLGTEVGWLGFPAIASQSLCFFSGRTSCYSERLRQYLVDGVAINGVSGGPAFFCPVNSPQPVVVGVVAAYIANRATGETLPGLSVVTDASHFQNVVQDLRTVDEAKSKEVQPPEPLPPREAGTSLSR